jgi:hypothetical protein
MEEALKLANDVANNAVDDGSGIQTINQTPVISKPEPIVTKELADENLSRFLAQPHLKKALAAMSAKVRV